MREEEVGFALDEIVNRHFLDSKDNIARAEVFLDVSAHSLKVFVRVASTGGRLNHDSGTLAYQLLSFFGSDSYSALPLVLLFSKYSYGFLFLHDCLIRKIRISLVKFY